MAKFSLKRTVDLSEFGWEGCSIVLSAATYSEILEWQKDFKDIDPKDEKAQGKIFDLVKDKFISGTALDENDKKVEIDKGDLGDLPLDVMIKCITSLRGNIPDPNSQGQLN